MLQDVYWKTDIIFIKTSNRAHAMYRIMTIKISSPRGGGRVLRVYKTGTSEVLFGVENFHPQYLFESRHLSRICLGLKVC